MLAELAAANAAFSVIKQFVSNGKELSGCAKHISDFVFSKEEIEKNIASNIPMKRVGEAEDLAGLITSLASQKADYMTGLAIQVDGGSARTFT